MTQKEAIIKALEILGGRALLSDIYSHVLKMTKFKPGSNAKATIRTTLQRNPYLFRQSEAKRGVWELVSFQEDIAVRDRRIRELEEENARLRAVKTEDDFVKRLVKETKNLYKHERSKTEVIRQILYKVGRSDAEEELDAYAKARGIETIMYMNGGEA